MRHPYIGITDFMNPEQVESAVKMLLQCPQARTERLLGVGVMMSYKTLNGLPTKWSKAFPKKHDVADIFIDSPHVYNVLHYADFDEIDFERNLEQVRFFGGSNLHAIQLDMCWPDPRVLHLFKQKNRDVDLILQIGTKALEMVEHDPVRLVGKLSSYNMLEAVLLYKSMGKGLGMDAESLLPFIRKIHACLPNLRLVVAGGLGPKRTHLVEPIIREFPLVSADAQGQLRESASALDPIEWGRAFGYVWEMMEMYKKYDRVTDSVH